MKDQLKQLGIAAGVLAAAALLFLGWRSWHYRPQTLADILPVALENIDRCAVQVGYTSGMEDLSFSLTPEQLAELLERLSAQSYCAPRDEDGYPQITMEPYAHLFLHSGYDHMKLILLGKLIWVCPLTFHGKDRLYAPEGGQAFQEEIVTFLANCANNA